MLDSFNKLSCQLVTYLPDSLFAEIIAFSSDFRQKLLTVISGGINYFLASTKDCNGWLVLPGSYLGISETEEFVKTVIPFDYGDTFYFMTDGITDLITRKEAIDVHSFTDTVSILRQNTRDDCTAVCINIFGQKDN